MKSPAICILIISPIHDLYRAQLFAIHPDTHYVQLFVAYVVILDDYNYIANVLEDVEHATLTHH